jgi:hypothetical protein
MFDDLFEGWLADVFEWFRALLDVLKPIPPDRWREIDILSQMENYTHTMMWTGIVSTAVGAIGVFALFYTFQSQRSMIQNQDSARLRIIGGQLDLGSSPSVTLAIINNGRTSAENVWMQAALIPPQTVPGAVAALRSAMELRDTRSATPPKLRRGVFFNARNLAVIDPEEVEVIEAIRFDEVTPVIEIPRNLQSGERWQILIVTTWSDVYGRTFTHSPVIALDITDSDPVVPLGYRRRHPDAKRYLND